MRTKQSFVFLQHSNFWQFTLFEYFVVFVSFIFVLNFNMHKLLDLRWLIYFM